MPRHDKTVKHRKLVAQLHIDEGVDALVPEEADTHISRGARFADSLPISTSTETKPRPFLCVICRYRVIKDKAEHESQYVHSENISRLRHNLPIMGKASHCQDCGVSMPIGYLDKHLSKLKHKNNVNRGKQTYTLPYYANFNVAEHYWGYICTCGAQCSSELNLALHKKYFKC